MKFSEDHIHILFVQEYLCPFQALLLIEKNWKFCPAAEPGRPGLPGGLGASFYCQSRVFKNNLFLFLAPAQSRIKVTLASIMPVPTKKKPQPRVLKDGRQEPKILTTSDALDFIKEKDKDYQELVESRHKKIAPATQRNLNMGKKCKEDLPQPVVPGLEGYKCLLCWGEFGDENELINQKDWVICPWCKGELHVYCIRGINECVCEHRVRVQRKPRQ